MDRDFLVWAALCHPLPRSCATPPCHRAVGVQGSARPSHASAPHNPVALRHGSAALRHPPHVALWRGGEGAVLAERRQILT